MEQKKSCQNCKFFIRYYVKKSSYFMSVYNGNCREHSLTAKERRSFPFAGGCEKWESDEEIKSNRKVKICEAIDEMRNHLCHIEQILLQDKFNQ